MKSEFNIVNGTLISYLGNKKHIEIPSSVTIIGSGAFENSRVKSVKLPDGIKSIESRAFINCKALSKINIPFSVNHIGEKAFMNCSNLEDLDLEANIKKIASKCFFDCLSLRHISIPEGVEAIESEAFSGCDNLLYIIIPLSLTYIGYMAFLKSGLIDYKQKIYIVDRYYGQHKIDINQFAFENFSPWICASIIAIPELRETYNTLFIETNSLSIDKKFVSELAINNFGSVGRSFDNEKKCFKSIKIVDFQFASKIIEIKDDTFSYFSNLKSVQNLPITLTILGKNAFRGTAISEIYLPKGVEVLDDYCFAHCIKLNEITIPITVNKIGECSFLGCVSLERINYEGTINEWKKIKKGLKWNGVYEDNTDIRPEIICKDGVIISDSTTKNKFTKYSNLLEQMANDIFLFYRQKIDMCDNLLIGYSDDFNWERTKLLESNLKEEKWEYKYKKTFEFYIETDRITYGEPSYEGFDNDGDRTVIENKNRIWFADYGMKNLAESDLKKFADAFGIFLEKQFLNFYKNFASENIIITLSNAICMVTVMQNEIVSVPKNQNLREKPELKNW